MFTGSILAKSDISAVLRGGDECTYITMLRIISWQPSTCLRALLCCYTVYPEPTVLVPSPCPRALLYCYLEAAVLDPSPLPKSSVVLLSRTHSSSPYLRALLCCYISRSHSSSTLPLPKSTVVLLYI